MFNPEDPFSGTWKLNPAKSNFDQNHRPAEATMRFERGADGYHMQAEGVKEGGQKVTERPQTFHLDGKEYPVSEAPGITEVSTRPDTNTIRAEARSGGQVLGRASYAVSEDGATLTATVSGTDAHQRPFNTVVVWDRM